MRLSRRSKDTSESRLFFDGSPPEKIPSSRVARRAESFQFDRKSKIEAIHAASSRPFASVDSWLIDAGIHADLEKRWDRTGLLRVD